jgi:hypothetical protein
MTSISEDGTNDGGPRATEVAMLRQLRARFGIVEACSSARLLERERSGVSLISTSVCKAHVIKRHSSTKSPSLLNEESERELSSTRTGPTDARQ